MTVSLTGVPRIQLIETTNFLDVNESNLRQGLYVSVDEMDSTQSKGTSLQIPVIDLSGANAQIADKLIDAIAQVGFVFVNGEGLGFTSQTLNDVFALVSSKHVMSCYYPR